jgi:hypothetical protein
MPGGQAQVGISALCDPNNDSNSHHGESNIGCRLIYNGGMGHDAHLLYSRFGTNFCGIWAYSC